MPRTSEILNLSVIIPFKNRANMTIDCLRSLLKYAPEVEEILLVSNNSSADELAKIVSAIKEITNTKLLEYNQPFNYQRINNWAVSRASSKCILFLNNDIELVKESKGLLNRMYRRALEPSVGAVGCLLLYGDRRVIQHAGVFLMPRGMADHLYVGKKLAKIRKYGGTNQDFPYSITRDRPLSGVTAAACIIEKAKFLAVNGFDENFIIGGGDVDICLRLNTLGYQTWYVSDGYMLHKESQSRLFQPIPYSDFYYSYLSYLKGYDHKVGDPFLPKITEKMK